MMWCTICDVRGHSTSECWYKPKTSTYNKYIKEIRKENGKLKKKYSLIPQHNTLKEEVLQEEVEANHQHHKEEKKL